MSSAEFSISNLTNQASEGELAHIHYAREQRAEHAYIAIKIAHAGLALANSWRNFLVSACGITEPTHETGSLAFHGTNQRPNPNSRNDIHAEETVLGQCVATASNPLSVLAIVGDVQPDQTAPNDTDVLLPCERRCTPQLEESKHVTCNTLLVSSNKNLTTVSYYDLDELQQFHYSGNPDLLTTIEFETPNANDPEEWQEKFVDPLKARPA